MLSQVGGWVEEITSIQHYLWQYEYGNCDSCSPEEIYNFMRLWKWVYPPPPFPANWPSMAMDKSGEELIHAISVFSDMHTVICIPLLAKICYYYLSDSITTKGYNYIYTCGNCYSVDNGWLCKNKDFRIFAAILVASSKAANCPVHIIYQWLPRTG